jgi:hypothetical protein
MQPENYSPFPDEIDGIQVVSFECSNLRNFIPYNEKIRNIHMKNPDINTGLINQEKD